MFSIFVKTNCVMEILEGLFHLSKHYEDAGEVWMVEGLDFSKPDIHDIVHIADCFARFGCSVIIPRPVHYKSEQYSLLFGNLIGTKFERKCPDLIVDGRFYEYESYVRPWNKRKLANMLSDGLKQSDRIILDNRSGTSLRQILRAINARLNVNAQIAEVWVYDGDSILDIYPQKYRGSRRSPARRRTAVPSNFLEAVAKLITFLGFSIVISQYCPRRHCRRLHDSFQRLA